MPDRRIIVIPLVFLIAAAFAFPAAAQRLKAGPQVLTYFSTVDDRDQPYAIYIPDNFDESRAYPLVISLHGAGSNHRLNLRRVFGKSNAEGENDVEASRYFPEWEDVEYIVASPYARGTMGYQGVAEKDVYDVLEDVKRRFIIDEDRIYLTGLSMGGGGTLWLGLTRPDIWAAIAPVCPAPPPGTKVLAGNALNIPVRIFQGGADPVVPADSSRAWADLLGGLGTGVSYDEYPGVGHDSWVPAYANGQVFDWFDGFSREKYPARVRFASDRYAYDRAYWVRLDALAPGALAQIDAVITAPDRIEITTSSLDGFTLALEEHPGLVDAGSLAIAVDGAAFDVPAGKDVSFSRRGGAWVPERFVAAEGAKAPGREGPIGAALSERHIYVYGTADAPSEELARARYDQALTAATWSIDRGPFWGRVMVFPRVVEDEQVRPSDIETSHLILFGTRATNRLIAEYAERLPMHLTDDSGEYGLAYIYPMGDHYVVISSGKPWWEYEAGGGRFANQIPALKLMDMPDYVLFRGSEMLAAGRFDGSWKLSPEAVERLSATKVVDIRQDFIGMGPTR